MFNLAKHGRKIRFSLYIEFHLLSEMRLRNIMMTTMIETVGVMERGGVSKVREGLRARGKYFFVLFSTHILTVVEVFH